MLFSCWSCIHVRTCALVAGVSLEVGVGCQQLTAMHLAAVHGQTAAIQQLAASGADPSPLEQDGKTPLHLAAEVGHEEEAAALLAVGGVVGSAAAARCKLLHAAVRKGDGGLLRTLIRAGAAVHADDWEGGQSLLHVAAARGYVSAVEVLVAAGIPVDVLNCSGCTPLHTAAAHEGSAAGAASLVSVAAAFDSSRTQMQLHQPDVSVPMQSGNTICVLKALMAAGADLEARDMHGCTAMHHAAKYGQVQVLQQLAAAGAAVYPLDATGHTPLHVAVKDGQAEVAAALQAIMARPDPQERGCWTPLPPIDAFFYVDVLQRLIAKAAGGAPDQPTKQLASAFVSLGVFIPMLEKALTEATAAAGGTQPGVTTILQHAVTYGNTQVLELLIIAGKLGTGS